MVLGFAFSVKLPRTITHDLGLADCNALLDRFADEATGLGDKLAVLLVQLPGKSELQKRVAGTFFRALRRRIGADVVVEPRHASWFAAGVDDWLAAQGIARAAAGRAVLLIGRLDQPGKWKLEQPALVGLRLPRGGRRRRARFGCRRGWRCRYDRNRKPVALHRVDQLAVRRAADRRAIVDALAALRPRRVREQDDDDYQLLHAVLSQALVRRRCGPRCSVAQSRRARKAGKLGSRNPRRLHSTLGILAPSITFLHFSVSATIISPNACGVPISGSPPRSTSRFFISR